MIKQTNNVTVYEALFLSFFYLKSKETNDKLTIFYVHRVNKQMIN